jgi:hypothetical protein
MTRNWDMKGLLKLLCQVVLPILLIILGLNWFNDQKLQTRLTKWKPVEAVVIQTSLSEKPESDSDLRFARIDYEYKVDGKFFEHRESFVERDFPNILAKYPKGTRLEVLRDPDDLAKSCMREGIESAFQSNKKLLELSINSLFGLALLCCLIWVPSRRGAAPEVYRKRNT